MDTGRIASFLAPFVESPLSVSQLANISMYINILLRWNARINLTAIRNPQEIVTRHFGESLFLARHLFGEAGGPLLAHVASGGPVHVLDIGSGAGFPALPLKIWSPGIHLTMVESNHKKAAFLREVSRALTLTNVNVSTDRAETLAARPDFPRSKVVTLRAVERFDSILPHALSLVAPSGRIALLIGSAQASGLPEPTIHWNPPIPIPRSQSRVLSIGVRQ